MHILWLAILVAIPACTSREAHTTDRGNAAAVASRNPGESAACITTERLIKARGFGRRPLLGAPLGILRDGLIGQDLFLSQLIADS
jgi:hypothetical protein